MTENPAQKPSNDVIKQHADSQRMLRNPRGIVELALADRALSAQMEDHAKSPGVPGTLGPETSPDSTAAALAEVQPKPKTHPAETP